MKKVFAYLLLALCSSPLLFAQRGDTTAEEVLSRLTSILGGTSIGGYGDAVYENNFNQKEATVDLERVVLFVGHTFGSVSYFSELEMEDAKVSGDELGGGEIAFEQAYLRFNLDQSHYVTAGLFLPRIGILNENHLPTEFNGNERTQVETTIIPSTWRELGIGFYGSLSSMPLNYSVALVNGLNSAAFEHGSGIREGRFEGRNASANNLALTGSVQLTESDLKLEASGYYGGSVGLSPQVADSLQLASGPFGTPVVLGEADLQYSHGGFSVRALGTLISIPNAYEVNRAYGKNTPSKEYGVYAEIAYDILHPFNEKRGRQCILFARYEKLDMNASVPSNGLIDGTLNQNYVVVGVSYFPLSSIVLKADLRLIHTGPQNPALILYSGTGLPSYNQDNTLVDIGLGYSF
ncbi:MAG TPA: hypothetical protein VMG34_00560 [Bacteroidota bacterium]|nr:hypothetical protein [Bacteroidota bacterium]